MALRLLPASFIRPSVADVRLRRVKVKRIGLRIADDDNFPKPYTSFLFMRAQAYCDIRLLEKSFQIQYHKLFLYVYYLYRNRIYIDSYLLTGGRLYHPAL